MPSNEESIVDRLSEVLKGLAAVRTGVCHQSTMLATQMQAQAEQIEELRAAVARLERLLS